VCAQFKAPDVAQPHGKPQRTQEPLDDVVAGEPTTQQTREVVEERVADSLKSEKATLAGSGRLPRERTESVVLPQDVVPALDAVSDPEAPLPRDPDQPTVPK